jgi:phospholipase/lecithinase/hemolysin
MDVRMSHSRAMLAGLMLALLCPVALANGYKEVVAFGDSLSDSGNHFAVFGESSRQPFEPVPSAPYAIGGHHFSNGRTWIERLAQRLAMPQVANPALSPSARGSNYAVGQARARANAPEFPLFDFGTQVGLFLSDRNGLASGDALYVVWIGGNDVRDALMALFVGGGSEAAQFAAQAIMSGAMQATADGILALYASGARQFLVVNVPNPGHTPAIAVFGPEAQFVATLVAGTYNAALTQLQTTLGQALPGVSFVPLDADGVLAAIIASPADAGFGDVVTPCLRFGQINNAICARPDKHLFWDAAHPTRRGHALLSQAAAQVLGID